MIAYLVISDVVELAICPEIQILSYQQNAASSIGGTHSHPVSIFSFFQCPSIVPVCLYTATSLTSHDTLLDSQKPSNCFLRNRSPGELLRAFLKCDRLVSISFCLSPFLFSFLLIDVDMVPEDMEATLNHRERATHLRLAKQVHKGAQISLD